MTLKRWPWRETALPSHLRADADGNRALWAHVQTCLSGLSRRQWRRLLDMPDLLDAATEVIWLTCGRSVIWGASHPDLNDPRRTSGKRSDAVRSCDGFFDAAAIAGVRLELRDGTIAPAETTDAGQRGGQSASGRLGHFNLSAATDIEEWERVAGPLRRDSRGKVRAPSKAAIRRSRHRILYWSFTQAAIETRPVADLIASPLDDKDLRAARAQQAAAIVWFEARVAPAAARDADGAQDDAQDGSSQMTAQAARVMLALVAHPTVLATLAWDDHEFPFVDHHAGASRGSALTAPAGSGSGSGSVAHGTRNRG